MSLQAFRFKRFSVAQEGAAHPVGTDAVLLGAWADVQGVTRFLDIGTGTGVVALMVAQRLSAGKNWKGLGVEIHPISASLARSNFAASPWAHQLEVLEGPIQQFSGSNGHSVQEPFRETYDLIVSNPPFFSELTVSPDKTRSLGRHTASLSPGDLLVAVGQLLAPKGRFCVVLPTLEGRRLCELAVPEGLYWTKIVEVRSRPDKPVERLLLQFEKSPYGIQRETLCLFAEGSGNHYSIEFQEMTRDFYLAGT